MSERLYAEAGKRIRDARIAKGYTREQLANISHVSKKFIYEIETGKKGFSVYVLDKLSKALDVSCDYIVTGVSMPKILDNDLCHAIGCFNDGQIAQLPELLNIICNIGKVPSTDN